MVCSVPPEKAQLIKKMLRPHVEGKFRLVTAEKTETGWMAMVSKPGNVSERFRCIGRHVINEATVGDHPVRIDANGVYSEVRRPNYR